MPGRLIVCPTPIGNLEDLSPRAARALEEADIVACEDTRRAGRLYERLEIAPPAAGLLPRAERGRARPPARRPDRARGAGGADLRRRHPGDLRSRLPADPRLHRARRSRSRCCPGPSAVTTALVASGLPADRWRFEGFLPRRAGELERVLGSPETVVAFESPRRLPGLALGARRARARPRGRGLPRADQAARGGRPRHAGRARAPLSRGRQGRDRRRDRARLRRAPPAPTSPSRSTRCAAWSSPAHGRGPPRASSRRSPGPAPTTSTAA